MIAVAGATGILGGMIARRLLDEGKDVRILVRSGSPSDELAAQGRATPAAGLVERGAEPVECDLREAESLAALVDGADAVVTTANSASRGGDDNPQTVDLDGNRNLIEAARAAGVRHFVFVSALGAAREHPAPFMQAKAQSEATLRESGMDYTILAPTAFMEIWPALVVGLPALQRRPVTLVGEARRRHSFVSNRDVAAFAVAALERPEARNRAVAVGGPEALTWRDVVTTYERVLGRSLEVEFVAPGDPVPGVPEPLVQILAGMEGYDSAVDMEEPSRTFGVELTTLETFAREQVGALAP